MKNVLVVFNYNAGRKKAIKYKKILHKFLLKRCQKFKFITVDELDDTDLSEYDTVLAAGGDGTVNDTAQKLVNTDKVLGIIPSGTANLLAYKLGINADLKRTLKIFDKNNIRKIDILDINGKPSFLRCGFGYDSDIICKTPQSLKNKFGYFAYFIAGIIFALRLTPKKYDITYDEQKLTVDATCIIIANAPNMYRNLFSLGIKSELDDGLFDVFVLKAKNPVTFFLEFLLIGFGLKKDSSRACYFKAKELKIRNSWTTCHIDGEKTKLKNNIYVGIIPSTLKVLSNR